MLIETNVLYCHTGLSPYPQPELSSSQLIDLKRESRAFLSVVVMLKRVFEGQWIIMLKGVYLG